MAQITLNSTGVASSGALVLQSNGTTTAVTISTAQVATLEKDAVVNGLTVGRGAGAVSTNTAVGASALAANQAGGTNNTAIGNAALDANTTGDENTAVGSDALGASTTANRNTALGYQAGYATTTGGINVFVGSYAGNNNNGTQNVAVGDSALQTSGAGTNNIAIGYSSATANTSGGSNVAIGTQALASNTTASNNTAVGYQAGYSQTTPAASNTYVGHTAGYTNVTGQRNVYIGQGAGYLATGSGNTLVGYVAGTQLTTGSNNTFIGGRGTGSGDGAGWAITTGSNNTIIGQYGGNAGGLNITTSSNYIVLSDGDGNPRAWGNGNGHFCFTNSSTIYNVNNTCFDINQNQSDYTLQMINSNASAPYGAFVRFSGSDPNNTTSFIFGGYAGSSYIYRIYSNGTVAARSDARLKKNIELARNGYLEDLNQIEIVKYNWNSAQEGTPKELGWIAQQVETVFPGLVQTDIAEDGTECKSVKLSVFTPMLIKALQELNAKVEAQAAELAALKGTA